MLYKQKNRGFTLIELLVVIAIIGILSSVVLASLNTARKKARDARRVSDMKQLQLALELFFDANNNAYPVSATQGDASTALAALVTNGYISVIPSEPSSGAAYQYISDANGADYCLGADIEGTVPSPGDTCSATLDITTTGIDYKVGP